MDDETAAFNLLNDTNIIKKWYYYNYLKRTHSAINIHNAPIDQ
jgi:hypothetical protein